MLHHADVEGYKQALRDEMNSLADNVLQGTLDFEEYKKACGVIHGLAIAERKLLDVVEAAEERERADK